jgi:hypothetical protein
VQDASRGELGVNNGDDNRQQAKKKETPANQIDLLESGNGPQKPFGPSQTRLFKAITVFPVAPRRPSCCRRTAMRSPRPAGGWPWPWPQQDQAALKAALLPAVAAGLGGHQRSGAGGRGR